MEVSISIREFAGILEQLLAKSPSKAGQRLCSERELAGRLSVDRMKVQKAFELLVEKGILARRHGSGTFVRKVPQIPGKAAKVKWGDRVLGAEDLFAKPSAAPRRQIRQEHRRLRLALLPNENWQSESNNLVFEGIEDRIKQQGHELEIHTSHGDAGKAWPQLVEELRDNPADGYILWTPYLPILNEAFQGKHPPAVFIGAQTREVDLKCAPIVRVDLEDALVRGLGLLAEEGYEKIGLIGFDSLERQSKVEQVLYEETMSKLGRSYRAAIFCPLNEEAALERMREMFAAEDRPEAVYVADDIVLRNVLPAWKMLGIVPGENLAVISLANRRNALPTAYEWSRIEFHPFQVGRMAVDSLLQEIETAGEEICSFEHLGVWIPGKTHRLTQK
jgi:DNA-binding LacI/PurR family transcriptional regulator